MRDVPPVVLTIAGSDPSGGAGLQADLRAIAAHAMYGAAVPTALTVQNTRGVSRVVVLDADLVRDQIDAVLEDLPVAAVKVGMLGSAAVAAAVLDAVGAVGAPVVLDPVIRSSSGAALLDAAGVAVLRERAAGLALITPNRAEAAALLGRGGAPDVLARELAIELGCRVLVTGGDADGACVDWLASDGLRSWSAARIDTPHDHGTGCLLSTSIACALAGGMALVPAVEHGRACVRKGLEDSLAMGAGTGPVYFRAR